MKRTLILGFSPCPNDTFIFRALAEGSIDSPSFAFKTLLADVEVLNKKARRQELDVTKVSASAVLHLLDDYWMLRAGGAMGRGCGPLVVARTPLSIQELRHKILAIPGKYTTANLLLRLQGSHEGPVIELPFDRIMPKVAAGEVDAGLIIHEGRFTYPTLGLKLVLDLGAWWESQRGLPLPLGVIMIRRSLGPEVAATVEETIRQSLEYTREHAREAWPYIRSHAQEMEESVIRRHIEMFVNEFSLDLGEEGEQAIRALLKEAAHLENIPFPDKPLFWDQKN
ncbi:MAG: 1,4-dihydroxy-6-naphthoate synthase [Syntrophobacteraceae bacterium]|nr:1,4-dihydroxy-6-naphthoate synthase [Syntrophobacteraceae bacterium]